MQKQGEDTFYTTAKLGGWMKRLLSFLVPLKSPTLLLTLSAVVSQEPSQRGPAPQVLSGTLNDIRSKGRTRRQGEEREKQKLGRGGDAQSQEEDKRVWRPGNGRV